LRSVILGCFIESTTECCTFRSPEALFKSWLKRACLGKTMCVSNHPSSRGSHCSCSRNRHLRTDRIRNKNHFPWRPRERNWSKSCAAAESAVAPLPCIVQPAPPRSRRLRPVCKSCRCSKTMSRLGPRSSRRTSTPSCAPCDANVLSQNTFWNEAFTPALVGQIFQFSEDLAGFHRSINFFTHYLCNLNPIFRRINHA
jgi:hypothetical protein